MLAQPHEVEHISPDMAAITHTKSWRLMEQVSGTNGRTTLTYEVRLKKKTTRAALIDAIAREAAPHVATATFQA